MFRKESIDLAIDLVDSAGRGGVGRAMRMAGKHGRGVGLRLAIWNKPIVLHKASGGQPPRCARCVGNLLEETPVRSEGLSATPDWPQGVQDLHHLTPKRGFIPAEALEQAIVEFREPLEAMC